MVFDRKAFALLMRSRLRGLVSTAAPLPALAQSQPACDPTTTTCPDTNPDGRAGGGVAP
jgi:hypothetical protein